MSLTPIVDRSLSVQLKTDPLATPPDVAPGIELFGKGTRMRVVATSHDELDAFDNTEAFRTLADELRVRATVTATSTVVQEVTLEARSRCTPEDLLRLALAVDKRLFRQHYPGRDQSEAAHAVRQGCVQWVHESLLIARVHLRSLGEDPPENVVEAITELSAEVAQFVGGLAEALAEVRSALLPEPLADGQWQALEHEGALSPELRAAGYLDRALMQAAVLMTDLKGINQPRGTAEQREQEALAQFLAFLPKVQNDDAEADGGPSN